MKCEDFQYQIDEYLDGELGRAAAASVDAHLSGCAACSSIYEEARRELDMYVRYEREVEVTPALWAAIATRIKREEPAPHKSWLGTARERLAAVFAAPRLSPAFAAALVLVAIGLTVAVTTFINSRNGDKNSNVIAVGPNNNAAAPASNSGSNAGNTNQVQPPAQTPPARDQVADSRPEDKQAAPAPEREKSSPAIQKQQIAKAGPASAGQTASQLVQEAEQKYLAAINLLERDVKRTKLDPAIRARFEVALADIDRTIGETRKVVRQNPGDPGALQYLLGAYSKKVDVLREMSRESVTEDQD